MKNKGLLIAAALILAALYIFGEEDEPFTVTFTLDALPRALRDRIELLSDGMLVTCTRIGKNSDFIPSRNAISDRQWEGIVVNKLRDAFGLREKWSKE